MRRESPGFGRSMRRCIAVFFLLATSPALRAGEVELNGRTFRVPDGLTVELVASSPLVDRPIVADFDEEGRLYVADSSGSNEPVARQLETKPHRIVRLEDLDGDGRFDRSNVYADRVMFPEGAMWLDGSLYIAAPPSIWKFTDRDGDGFADERVEWFQGGTLTGCANDLHGPYEGLDGRIYWCKGAFAEQRYERPGREPFVTRAAHIFRARRDGTGIEPVMTGGMDNPVEVVFTPEGERIFTTTFFQHPGGGKRDGLVHAIYGGVYGKIHGVIDGHPRTGDVLPVLTHLGPAAPCGLARYRSRALGNEYENNLFASLFNLHKVTRHELEPDGSTYRTRDSDFLACDDPDFHPTDVLEDADGSLLVVDTGGWYKICCPSSQLWKPDVLGAIYRVRRSDRARIDDARGREIEWEEASPEDLASRLGDPRPAVRDRARNALSRRGGAAVAALRLVLVDGTPRARRGAVWTLARIGDDAARAALRNAIVDKDASVRHAAAHAASVILDPEALPALLGLLGDDDPALRRVAAEAIGRLGNAEAVPALLASLPHATDRMLEHSLTYALIEIGAASPTRRGLDAEDPATRRAALIALDQMRGAKIEASTVASFLASSDPELRKAASWVLGRHPEWAGELASLLASRLRDIALAPGERTVLIEQLARTAKDPAVSELLEKTAGDEALDVTARTAALEAMARARLDPAPPKWKDAIARALTAGDSAVVKAGVDAAAGSPPARESSEEIRHELLAIAAGPSRAPSLRIDAVAALPKGPDRLDPGLFEFLRKRAVPPAPVSERSRAALVIARAKLGAEERDRLIEIVPDLGPLELRALLAAFANLEDRARVERLAEAFKSSAVALALDDETLNRLIESFAPGVRDEARELFKRRREDDDERRQKIDGLLASLPEGDVRRGQKVFNGEKAACSTCHAIGYLGGHVGPDLTRIGQIRSRRDLLEALVYPSSSFVRSYEPTTVITKRGEVHSGILRLESDEEVVLVTGAQTEVRLPVAEVAETSPGETSIMPSGLTEQLTPQELADLLAFLLATRW